MKDAGLSNAKAKRYKSPDPLGKRALFSVPTVADAGGSGSGPGAPDTGGDPEAGMAPVTKEGPASGRRWFTVRCQRCRQVSRVSPLDLLIFQLPVGVWFPRGQFDRRMICPSCRKRSWCSVTLRRDE
jgi:hypothetical protein